MQALNVNRVHLLDLIDPNREFVHELADVGCITRRQRDHIINIVQPRDRNDKLLEFLAHRSFADFKRFINILSREKADVVPLLLTIGGETFF